jgi:hypothetical protein
MLIESTNTVLGLFVGTKLIIDGTTYEVIRDTNQRKNNILVHEYERIAE